MNFEFSLRQLVIAGLLIVVVLLCAAFPSLLPLSFFKAIYKSVLSELEILHVVRTDALPMRVMSHANEEQNPEQIKKGYPRTRYEMYSPQDGLLNRPSEDTMQAITQIADQYSEQLGTLLDNVAARQHWLQARLNGEALSPEDEENLHSTLQKAAPLIKKALSASRNDAFAMGDIAQSLPRGKSEGNASPLVKMADVFALDALENYRQGKTTDAYFEIYNAAKALLPAPAARQEEQSAGLAGFDTVMHAWRTMATAEKNIGRLETALTQMNEVGSELRQRISQVRDPVSRDLMARIRELPLDKKERDSVERTTPDYLFNFYSEKAHKYTTDPTRLPALEKELEPLKARVEQSMESRGKNIPPNAQTLLEKTSLAEMDMMRIGLAEQVKHLANPDEKIGNLDNLSPRYIPYIPSDPFSDREYQLRKTDQVSTGTLGKSKTAFSLYYSIGPDGKDQKGQILYDPTNGANSLGDIYIP